MKKVKGIPRRCWTENFAAGTGSKFPNKRIQGRIKRKRTPGYYSDINHTCT
jgi:hypothetical protein